MQAALPTHIYHVSAVETKSLAVILLLISSCQGSYHASTCKTAHAIVHASSMHRMPRPDPRWLSGRLRGSTELGAIMSCVEKLSRTVHGSQTATQRVNQVRLAEEDAVSLARSLQVS